MADVMTQRQRRRCMSRIKGRDTKPELRLRGALWTLGFRYRLHSQLPGKPDLVFPGRRVAVFVDGCFWHGCPEHGVRPTTNSDFWRQKLDRNISRDREVTRHLMHQGWTVIRLWEHEVESNLDDCTNRIMAALGMITF